MSGNVSIGDGAHIGCGGTGIGAYICIGICGGKYIGICGTGGWASRGSRAPTNGAGAARPTSFGGLRPKASMLMGAGWCSSTM